MQPFDFVGFGQNHPSLGSLAIKTKALVSLAWLRLAFSPAALRHHRATRSQSVYAFPRYAYRRLLNFQCLSDFLMVQQAVRPSRSVL